MKSVKYMTYRKRNRIENCKKTKPWKHATGPKTESGKKISSQNALKHGNDSAAILALSKTLWDHSKMLDEAIKLHAAKKI